MRYPTHHFLLDRLAPEVIERLFPVLQRVSLDVGHVLYRAGLAVSSVYFPVTALIEEVLPLAVGSEQVLRRLDAQAVAGSCVLGDPVTSRTARVCRAGEAYRMEYADFVCALEEVPAFREVVLRDAVRASQIQIDSNELLYPDTPIT